MKFVERVTEFMQRYHYTPSQFGRAAMGDPNFVPRLLKGRQVTERIMDKVDQWMGDDRHRDVEIARLRKNGFTFSQISKAIGISEREVRRRATNIGLS